MSNQNRQPRGVPTGGRFAPHTHAEVDLALSDPAAPEIPTWGPSVNTHFDKAVERWIDENPEGEETTVLELLEISEEDAVTAYGEPRAAWLASLNVRTQIDQETTVRASWYGPAETEDDGLLEVYTLDADGREHDVICESWRGDDGPDVGYLTRNCPVDANGNKVFDRNDPRWDDPRFPGNARNAWAASGFGDPEVAGQWVDAGLGVGEAVRWDENGFGPAESGELVAQGKKLWEARRERAVRFAEELAEADMAIQAGADRSGAA